MDCKNLGKYVQLSLFQEPTDKKNERRIELCLESQDKLRKKLFAENNSLKKDIKELKGELELLKSHICKNKLFLC
jgi:hypothetical protein